MAKATLLVIGIFFLACNTSTKSSEDFKSVTSREELLKVDSYINEITDVNMLISFLNNTTDLETKHIGFTGERSNSYTYFERLSEIAPDTTLIRLSYSENPKLRVYGMWALTQRSKELALGQLKRFEKDKSSINFHSGCITMPVSVSYLVASRFDTTQIDTKRFK